MGRTLGELVIGEEAGRLDVNEKLRDYLERSVEYVRENHLNEEGKLRTVKILVLAVFTYCALCWNHLMIKSVRI